MAGCLRKLSDNNKICRLALFKAGLFFLWHECCDKYSAVNRKNKFKNGDHKKWFREFILQQAA